MLNTIKNIFYYKNQPKNRLNKEEKTILNKKEFDPFDAIIEFEKNKPVLDPFKHEDNINRILTEKRKQIENKRSIDLPNIFLQKVPSAIFDFNIECLELYSIHNYRYYSLDSLFDFFYKLPKVNFSLENFENCNLFTKEIFKLNKVILHFSELVSYTLNHLDKKKLLMPFSMYAIREDLNLKMQYIDEGANKDKLFIKFKDNDYYIDNDEIRNFYLSLFFDKDYKDNFVKLLRKYLNIKEDFDIKNIKITERDGYDRGCNRITFEVRKKSDNVYLPKNSNNSILVELI